MRFWLSISLFALLLGAEQTELALAFDDDAEHAIGHGVPIDDACERADLRLAIDAAKPLPVDKAT